MRLSAKIGLYTAVLAGVVGGTSAWAITDKAVAVSVDGQVRTVHTRAGTVGGALEQAHLSVAAHDAIAPAVTAPVHDGSKVILLRGRELHLTIDAQRRDVWTTATTVSTALSELGYGTGKAVSVSRSARLPLTPTQITLLTPKHVSVQVDRRALALITTETTVDDALRAAHVTLGPNDTVSAALFTPIADGQVLTVKRVRLETKTHKIKLPFTKKVEKDDKRLVGTTIIDQHGKRGSSTQTFQFIYVDGLLAGKRLLSTVMTKKPVTQITKVGTKKKPVAVDKPKSKSKSKSDKKSSSSSSKKSNSDKKSSSQSNSDKKSSKKSSSGARNGSSAPKSSGGSPKAIAAGLVNDRGWGDSQYTCLVKLWNRESGWRVHAHNGSGAYGIPQALPGSKMSSAGPNWQDNAATQIKWGLGYISNRYGNPCGAWGHSQSHGWY